MFVTPVHERWCSRQFKMIKITFYRERICEYELKTNSICFGIVLFCQIQLAGLIEEHLDLGPTTDQQVLKSTFTSPA